MLNDSEFWMVQAMLRHGGSFVQALADCYERADRNNKAKLIMAFRDYFDKYHEWGLKIKQQETKKDE